MIGNDKLNDKKDYVSIAEKMYELYVTKEYPFIKQHKDGTYEWCYKYGSLSNNNYDVLVRHLQRKQTIGVMCHSHSKFILFDVDWNEDKNLARWYTYKIINTLQEFGFDSKYINVSYSGKKGYHISVCFDEIVSYKQIEYLYDLVIEEIYYTIDYTTLNVIDHNNMTLEQLKNKIELRPKINIGCKLPLGLHQVTGNVCYYCDNSTLEPIKDINYIFNIQQCPREYIEDAINIGKEFREDRNKINTFNNEIKSIVKPVAVQKLYQDETFTMEYIEELIKNGLQIQGSRHNSLMKIARYNYSMGYIKEDNEQLLVEWMKKQDKKYYKSDEIEWRKDIQLIVDYVYEKGKGLISNVRDVSINKNEMMEILKLHEKKKKLLFYALIIHFKRYSTKSKEFYMTYKQIMESTGITDKTAKKYLEELQKEGQIKIIRQNQRRNNSYKSLPNKYKIINNKININTTIKENNTYIINKNITNYSNELNKNIICLFNRQEIKTIIPYDQYRELIKLYA
jgi:hypothetical protein